MKNTTKILTVLVIGIFIIGLTGAIVNENTNSAKEDKKYPSEDKLTNHKKPASSKANILAFTSDKYKEEVSRKIAEKTNRTKITITVVNATYVNATEIGDIEVGTKIRQLIQNKTKTGENNKK